MISLLPTALGDFHDGESYERMGNVWMWSMVIGGQNDGVVARGRAIVLCGPADVAKHL